MRSQVLAEFLDHHRFIVRPIPNVHLRDGVSLKNNQMRADAVEEPAVVADDEGDACEFGEGFFEGAQAVDI